MSYMSELRRRQVQGLVEQTRRMIDYRGEDITLTRPGEKVSDGAGGETKGTSVTMPTVRRWVARLDTRELALTGFTTAVPTGFAATHMLIGMPGDDIQEGDWFWHQGRKRLVIRVDENFEYQTKAYVGTEEKRFLD